eukprot:100046_1
MITSSCYANPFVILICVVIGCILPLIFGILFLVDVFNVTDNIKYGVGMTLICIGGICCCMSCIYILCSGGGGGRSKRGDIGMVAMMLVIQSGMNLNKRYNFKTDSKNKIMRHTTKKKIDKKLLIKMLERENELRLSEEVIQKYENE